MKARYLKKTFVFKRPGGTSRGVLTKRDSWFIILSKDQQSGIGECAPLKGLSIDDHPDYENKLKEVAENIDQYAENLHTELENWPSIRFGLEMATRDLSGGGNRILFPGEFVEKGKGIPINGLIWMGKKEFLLTQIKDLISRGFRCLKMKIGAIEFEDEMNVLRLIRKEFPVKDMVLRVDANGAFNENNALEKLKKLSELNIHSIEQPVMAGQYELMADLCEKSPIPIALDEELIPVTNNGKRKKLLEEIQPQYIILKPSLLGGFHSSKEWIDIADEQGISWWITSALESNIGLNAISQWTYTLDHVNYQGLGTGSLFTNNIPSPLQIKGEKIFYFKAKPWILDEFF